LKHKPCGGGKKMTPETREKGIGGDARGAEEKLIWGRLVCKGLGQHCP